MPNHVKTVEVEVRIVTTDEGEAGIDRYVDLPEDNEWMVTPGMSKEDVLLWLATSCVYGHDDANQDGWADLDRDSIHCYIDNVQELW